MMYLTFLFYVSEDGHMVARIIKWPFTVFVKQTLV
jgi:hypothetical protein